MGRDLNSHLDITLRYTLSHPQRISILQQLLQQEVEGLARGKCAHLNEASSLDMVELQSLLAEIPRTLNGPEHNSEAFHLPELLQQSGLPKPCLSEECGELQCSPRAEPEVAQLCPIAEPGPPVSCHRREPEIPEPTTQEQPKVSEAFPLVEPGPLQVCPQGQTGLSEPSPRAELGASEACSLEPRNPESSPQPCCSLWAPATTSVIFSSQRPLCASPPIRSLQSMRPPIGQAGKELVRRSCEQMRFSSLTGSGIACPVPGDPMLSFFHLPCPSPALLREEGQSWASSPVLLIGLVLGGGMRKAVMVGV